MPAPDSDWYDEPDDICEDCRLPLPEDPDDHDPQECRDRAAWLAQMLAGWEEAQRSALSCPVCRRRLLCGVARVSMA